MEDLTAGKKVPASAAASVFIVWAQALIYGDEAADGNAHMSSRSLSYFEQA